MEILMRKAMAYVCSTFALAVFVAVIVATTLCLIMGDFSGSALPMFPLFFVGALFVVLIYALVFGLPYAVLLRRLGRFRLAPMMMGGLVAGCLPDIVFRAWLFVTRHDDVLRFAMPPEAGDGWVPWAGVLGEGVLGALAAAVFYGVFRRILPEVPCGRVAEAEATRDATAQCSA